MERQQELFGEFKDGESKPNFFGKGATPEKTIQLNFTREKFIILSLGVIIVLVIVYAFGYERGKKSMFVKRAVAQPITKPQPLIAPTTPAPATTKPQPVAIKPYTIQVATFKTKEYAQQEVAKLKTKGYSTTLVGINGFYQVWAGEYATAKEAEQALNVLKKTYKSCYIRKR